MAAGEDQPQTVVVDGFVVIERCWLGDGTRIRRDRVGLRREPRIAPRAIDRPVAPRTHQPRTGIGWNSVALPLGDRGGERVLHAFFGRVEVAEKSNECRENSRGVLAIHSIDDFVNLRIDHIARATIGRTSIDPLFAAGIRSAMRSAASRSLASIMK